MIFLYEYILVLQQTIINFYFLANCKNEPF